MNYTASHWGSYQFSPGDLTLHPLEDDPMPSRIGRGWVSASRNTDSRILAPVIRKGWLDGDRGLSRRNDEFVEVSWDKALDLVVQEICRVRASYGNGAIFGGSYGWASAGRFHHTQSQLRRFLFLAGGCVTSRDTYSHAAAEVLFPHILGMSNSALQDQMTSRNLVTQNCEILLAFGGIWPRTAQVASAGTSEHRVEEWRKELLDKGVRVITVAPEKSALDKEWWAIRPGTDTALMLALIHTIVSRGLEDKAFLAKYTSGWDILKAYIMGSEDGVRKDAQWASEKCAIAAKDIQELALDLVKHNAMVTVAWSLQRTLYGEQPIWAGLALACVLGQIGQPGTGYAFGYGSTMSVGRPIRLVRWPSVSQGTNPVKDFIPVARTADMLLYPGQTYSYNGQTREYPDIRLVWWAGGNPFHHAQDLNRLDEAWTKPETVIVNDHSWTATARRADIVLPATTPLEREDVMINKRDPALIYMSKLFDPLGVARHDHDIFADLSARLGFEEAFTEGRSTEEWLRHIWRLSDQAAQSHGFSLPDFDDFRSIGRFTIPEASQDRIALKSFIDDPIAAPLRSESGRITLHNKTIEEAAVADCPGHPTWIELPEYADPSKGVYHLVSGQPQSRLHSQNDQGSESWKDKVNDRELCTLHPDAARQIGVVAGDIVCLSNERGSCLAAVRIEDGIRSDCISLPTGAWFDPQNVDGHIIDVHGNPNTLTLDKGCSGFSQGCSAHTAVVRAEKWTKPLPDVSVKRPPTIRAL